MLVQEIPKGYNPNVYFSSSINLSKKPLAVFEKPATPTPLIAGAESDAQLDTPAELTSLQRGKRNTGVVNYNISQLSQQSTTTYVQQTSQATLTLLEERKSSKRFQELDRENYAQDKTFEIPKNGFTKNRTGVTHNTKRILASRKNLGNYIDELDDQTIGLVFNLESYEDKNTTNKNAIKLCSICGNNASMKCVRCGVRFCCLKCNNLHNDTKCTSYSG
ncbi:hypothetical protein BABINDRAFT_39213 [Babjeviella inositovora NRRL Y-12698]|uniref:HIT-type domain-containing protein n=1 Tax=Babjeviella inositovora NRRL Y-12698 TaxID=984486 RepID=A0A1E3QLE3_9ASCO|nr:uncharacterized protein BABINDRAFT_39213 [Babjeviella inositovora NRRL Y-12698]ODQ78470.1 hypothetical protein BABINDRAFT_39213 [Babjeviella inositovora NRRL Y-12698]